ncbi:MAG: hypothetical protein AAGH15_18595 [Myxococcota bacterium]
MRRLPRALALTLLASGVTACAASAVTGDGVDGGAMEDEVPRCARPVDGMCEEGCFIVRGRTVDARSCFAGQPYQSEGDTVTDVGCVPPLGFDAVPTRAWVWDAATGACVAVRPETASALGWPSCEEALPSCDEVPPITDALTLCGEGLSGRRFDIPTSLLELDEACEGCTCASVLGLRCDGAFVPLAGRGTPGLALDPEADWPLDTRAPLTRPGVIAGERSDGRLHWACYADVCDAPPACDPVTPDRVASVRGRVVEVGRGLGDGPGQTMLIVESWTAAPP